MYHVFTRISSTGGYGYGITVLRLGGGFVGMDRVCYWKGIDVCVYAWITALVVSMALCIYRTLDMG